MNPLILFGFMSSSPLPTILLVISASASAYLRGLQTTPPPGPFDLCTNVYFDRSHLLASPVTCGFSCKYFKVVVLRYVSISFTCFQKSKIFIIYRINILQKSKSYVLMTENIKLEKVRLTSVKLSR